MDTPALSPFDVTAFQEADTAEMQVRHPVTGELTPWVITFAGPGHAKTVALTATVNRENLAEAREASRGRNRRMPSTDEVMAKNVRFVVSRMIGWTPVKIGDDVIEFSPDAATKLLSDPSYRVLYKQCFDFLVSDESFLPKSATS